MSSRILLFLLVLASSALAQTTTKITFKNIDQKTNWQNCTTCAGGLNTTPYYSGPTPSRFPSLDGNAAKFSFTGQTQPYTDVLWWNELLQGAKDVPTIAMLRHFNYDLYYYVTTNVAQALEFDMNQTICNDCSTTATSSTRYIFGTQCNLGTHTWDVWNANVTPATDTSSAVGDWVHTSLACSVRTYHWTHLQYEFQRTPDGKVSFVSITVDGRKSYLNLQFAPMAAPAPADDLNVAFQMDTNGKGTAFSAWLDKVTATAW